jgi:hypothetical protein
MITDNTTIAYSGTSVENYRKCAKVGIDRIYFDKSEEPRHFCREVHFEEILIRAIAQSIHHAMKLGHSPLVMEGELDLYNRRYRGGSMRESDWFPVDKVWVPKPGVIFSELDLNLFWKEQGNPEEYYMRADPLDLLRLPNPLWITHETSFSKGV